MTTHYSSPFKVKCTFPHYKCLITLFGILCLGSSPLRAWVSDNGDGTYTNPPLNADYPDPDIIRVGEDFYFASTTFVNVPGLTILHSKDLVNWEIVSHVVQRLDGDEKYDMINGTAYRKGIYAPSLRYHNGTFYVVVTPVGQNTRIYHTRAIEGPWKYYELDRDAFDPGFFIDDDGIGYIATSGGWDGTVTLLTLNKDYSKIVDSKEIFYNEGAEGSKIIKRGGWYYMFHSIPSKLALTCSRSKDLFGKWETVPQINDRTGGHQGALVDLPDGSDYGFVMMDAGSIGRITQISPMFWENDWPVWGTPDAPGIVPSIAEKPIQDKEICQPGTTDNFDSETLALQWQWNHNPDNSKWSLSKRPGFLRLEPTQAEDFWTAKNTLIQKGQSPLSVGVVKLDISHLAPGDICGFGSLGKINGSIAINCDAESKRTLSMQVINAEVDSLTMVKNVPVHGDEIYLKMKLDFASNKGTCSYSYDSIKWNDLGETFEIAYDWRTGTFQGEQFAIFCYNPNPGDGYLDIDFFNFSSEETTADNK